MVAQPDFLGDEDALDPANGVQEGPRSTCKDAVDRRAIKFGLAGDNLVLETDPLCSGSNLPWVHIRYTV